MPEMSTLNCSILNSSCLRNTQPSVTEQAGYTRPKLLEMIFCLNCQCDVSSHHNNQHFLFEALLPAFNLAQHKEGVRDLDHDSGFPYLCSIVHLSRGSDYYYL